MWWCGHIQSHLAQNRRAVPSRTPSKTLQPGLSSAEAHNFPSPNHKAEADRIRGHLDDVAVIPLQVDFEACRSTLHLKHSSFRIDLDHSSSAFTIPARYYTTIDDYLFLFSGFEKRIESRHTLVPRPDRSRREAVQGDSLWLQDNPFCVTCGEGGSQSRSL